MKRIKMPPKAQIKNLSMAILSRLKQKGQGIVEFALILGFCVGVWVVARDSGMIEALNNSFEQGVFAFLNSDVDQVSGGTGGSGSGGTGGSGSGGTGGSGSGGTGGSGSGGTGGSGSGGTDWNWDDTRRSDAPTSYYENAASREDRIAADQKSLENIAKHFIGLTRGQIKEMLNVKSDSETADMAYDKEVVLGHFLPVPNKQFEDGSPKGMMFTADNDGVLNEKYNEEIFLWMQGEEVVHPEYKDDYMYLVSDYVVSQTWADKGGTMQRNGLRIKFEYDYSGSDVYPESYSNLDAVKVVGVQLAIDPKSQDNKDAGLANSNNKFNQQSSKGLEVQVRLDGKDEFGKPKYLITHKNTAGETNKNTGGKGMANWYGEDFTQKAVQTLIQSGRADYSSGITKNFEKGEIFKFKDSYYIAKEKAENVTIENSYSVGQMESSIFVKFTGQSGRYFLVNTTSQVNSQNQKNKPIIIPEHGSLIILASGEVYIYVGDGKNIQYTGINELNKADFIMIRDKRTDES